VSVSKPGSNALALDPGGISPKCPRRNLEVPSDDFGLEEEDLYWIFSKRHPSSLTQNPKRE
jgi:hypothetical protein